MSLPRLELIVLVGTGGSSTVYRGRYGGQIYAVKITPVDREKTFDYRLDSSLREIDALKVLKHDNIVKMHHSLAGQCKVYAFFDLCEMDLRKHMRLNHQEGRGLTIGEARYIIKEVLKGIAYAHAQDFLHLDLKPDNILVTSDLDIKISDWGTSVKLDGDMRGCMQVLPSTYQYASTEQWFGSRDYSRPTDVWSCGIKGQILFQGNERLAIRNLIFTYAGVPTTRDWPMVSFLPDYYVVKVLTKTRTTALELIPQFSENPEALEFFELMTNAVPAKRPRASELLEHPFLRDPFPEGTPLLMDPNGSNSPDIFAHTPIPVAAPAEAQD